MANPASHFSLYDPSMDEGSSNAQAQRIPDMNGGLPPMMGQNPLMEQAVAQLMQRLMAPPPKRTMGDRLSTFGILAGEPTHKERDYQRDQENTRASLNAITGQQNAQTNMMNPYFKRDASERGWANIGLRGEEGLRGNERVQLARDRETRLGYGPAVKIESTDDNGLPTTVLGNQLPGGKGILLTDGTIIQPTMFPKPVKIQALMGQNEYGAYNPYTAQIGSTITGPGGTPFRPPLPQGVAENVINTQAAAGSIEQLRTAFNTYKGSGYPASIQRGVQLGAEKFPGITKDLTGAVGMGDEYTRQVSFMSDFNRALTDYVNSKSGKQYSYMEFLRFAHLFPNIATDNDTTFNSKVMNLMAAIERQYGLTTKLYPGASGVRGRENTGDEADGNTPERQYGPETTNVGGGNQDEWDAELDKLLGKTNAPK